ncbi:uncharacterized protein LOC123555111 [Mercenaria mercenaria]|uniref:uncharacterized protein LOC123555111 n=1 Tax=Mercenaria mercenaria TaxID=6596 RepID=UPI00234F70A6|nr:uncharacterized protein LOC123555111 [Mercenaria mercenaria]
MDLRSTLEKDSIELNQKNLFSDSKNVIHEHPKIDNIQWSIANEHLRASGNTEHYTTIKDTLNEDIRPRDSTEIGDRTLDISQRAGYPYVTFNGSEGFPTRTNDATTELYSYATRDDHLILHWHEREDENRLGHSYLSLNANGHSDQQISEDHSGGSNYFKYNGVQYHNNRTNLRLKDRSPFQEPGTSQTSSLYDNQKDTYLVPRLEKAKHTNLTDIDWQNNHPVSDGQNGYNQSDNSQLGTSTYVDKDIRIPECRNLATVIPKARKYSKRKIIIMIVVILLLLVAIASVVAVLLITKRTEDHDVCSDRDECQSKCLKYPDVSNGHVSSTEEVYSSSMVNISCNKGFRIDGNDTAICLDSGTWSHVATCEPVDCGKYLPPDHVLILESGQETKFNTSLSLTCDTGFQLAEHSNSFVWCNGDGHWSGNPKCENLVDLFINPSVFLIGETSQLTCEFRKAEWRKVVFRRASWNKGSVTIATIENNIVSYNRTTSNDKIKIKDSFTHDSGKVTITFETVQCSDAFEIPGDINFTCEVHMKDNLHVFHAERFIRIQGKPGAPILTISPHVVEGEDTTRSLFVCEMLFAKPNGKVIIESDYGGTYTTLLSSVNGEYETDAAWIEDIKTALKNCWYRMVVIFGLKRVSMKWHRKHIRCITKPSNSSSFDQIDIPPDNGVVKVLPERICQGQDLVLYPYNCGLYVECDKDDSYDSVLDVFACGNDHCYHVNTGGCSQCSLGIGCSVTDIYFRDGGSSEIGSALTIVCIVEDFKNLTDIKITRGNGEMVSSISTGDNIKGISTVPEMSHRNSTGGMLSVHISYLLCDDEATYRCFPEGGGKYSDDVIDLNMNC